MAKGTYGDLKKKLMEVPGALEYDRWFNDVCKRVESYGVDETNAYDIVLNVAASGDLDELKTINVRTLTGNVELDVQTVFSRDGYDF